MRRPLPIRQTFILTILFALCNGQTPTCSFGSITQCNVTTGSSALSITAAQITGAAPISIKYSGDVVLDLTSTSANSIVIEPIDENNHTLQISKINASANRIEIKIRLTSKQIAVSLFTSSCSIVTTSAMVIVNVLQTVPDASNFKIFAPSSTTAMNFDKFELIVSSTDSNVGNLYLPYLIFGLTSLRSVSISGSNHALTVQQSDMPQINNINQLSLKQLHLQDQILFNFKNLKFYSIEQCTYSRSSLFLHAVLPVNVSLVMKNNNPTDAVLPFDGDAFLSLGGVLTSLTLIEPKLNSTSLKAIQKVFNPSEVIISLNNYQREFMDLWAQMKPLFGSLTIQNIQTLDIFSPAFFSNFHQLKQVTLQGDFSVTKEAISIFVGIMKSDLSIYPIVTLQTPQIPWNNCTRTYIVGINSQSISDIRCGIDDSCQECRRWYDETVKCDLITYENQYVKFIQEKLITNYYYNNSVLYHFFEDRLCIYNETTDPPPKKESVNIGAIIGALCGLVVAAIILIITIYFVCRKRNRPENQYEPSAPQITKIRSSHDPSNVSIATSKTSKSSRYALEKSFFPTIQPHDEIAPPLYTAPSESVASTSNYQAHSAPSAPRDSISTHATHVYETVDP